MRTITAKFDSECRACGHEVNKGDSVSYEKRIGVFHPACEPEGEELRNYRQERIDKRNERLRGRANKLRSESVRIYKQDERKFGDIAFCTQPGHIPERARAIKRREKAMRLDAEADAIEPTITYPAQVKGDAEARRERRRESVKQWAAPGVEAFDYVFGNVTILKVYKKSARIRNQRTGSEFSRELHFLHRKTEN